jgi:two-component system, NtrC family, response regulator AtoC
MLILHALIVDDDQQFRGFLAEVLRDDGWKVLEAGSAEQAFEMLHEQQWSLVLCDVRLGGADGFEVLRRFKEELPQTVVILMTGYGTAVGALDATAFGAFDYLLKPFSVDDVLTLARSAREKIESKRRSQRVSGKEEATPGYTSDVDLVGRSAAFVEVMKLVGKVSPTNLPVLITGESGTGKEVIARAIHKRSHRANQPFVAINCGAIPGELIESELFGHVRGAFTGAKQARSGLWAEADGGTIFLDEITETAPAFQVKLLRALQERKIRPVGSNRAQQVDVRVIAASNREIEEEIKVGRFRQDLLYRLNAVTIRLPPLRERREDIMLLAQSFAEKATLPDKTPVRFSSEAVELLESYTWPGNVPELENAIVRATAICDGLIRPTDLPEHLKKEIDAPPILEPTAGDGKVGVSEFGDRWPTFAEWEKYYVKRVLIHTKGNRQAAARILEVDRKTIDRMIKRHQIDLESP